MLPYRVISRKCDLFGLTINYVMEQLGNISTNSFDLGYDVGKSVDNNYPEGENYIHFVYFKMYGSKRRP
jgi:hypothetical protein